MDVVMLGIVMIKNSYGIIMMPPTKFPLHSLFSTCQMIQLQKKKKNEKANEHPEFPFPIKK